VVISSLTTCFSLRSTSLVEINEGIIVVMMMIMTTSIIIIIIIYYNVCIQNKAYDRQTLMKNTIIIK
jgi:hypothetical protein